MFLFYIIYFFLSPVAIYAYLDPGSGSLLLYAVIGLLTTLVFALRGMWYWIGSHLFFVTKKIIHNLPSIVFHSEGGRYWHVFEPVICALNAMNIDVAYITPDKNDPAFDHIAQTTSDNQAQEVYNNLTIIHPGNNMVTLSYMNNITADIVISTTPQLDVMMWKRSKNVKHYAHLFHTPTDIGTYDLYAFDHYDSLFCVGEFQKKSIRMIEHNRNRKKKQLYDIGCTYYDSMKTKMESIHKQEGKKCILYAPTWGIRSSLVKYGKDIITHLGNSPYKIIFRPHPQLYVSNADSIKQIEDLINTYSNIILDKSHTPIDSMSVSDILLTDLSGIIFDYALLCEKPIILFEGHFDLAGLEAVDTDGLPVWDEVTAEKVTHRFDTKKMDTLIMVLQNVLKNTTSNKVVYKNIKTEIYNFGNAGGMAAKQIITIKKNIIKDTQNESSLHTIHKTI